MLAKLGQGGFGIIYRVQSLVNNNIYVMKEVAFEDRASLEAALSEKQLMSRVSHRYICKYVDSFIGSHGENKLYLIMEYADKGDLEQYL